MKFFKVKNFIVNNTFNLPLGEGISLSKSASIKIASN